jgi:hypothetical protein
MGVSESLLYELTRHCNNYFNPQNDPSDPTRNYPASFLELAGRIAAYNDDINKGDIVIPTGVTVAADPYKSWQKAFARELSIYKRVRFI